jgi:heme/copper-type cytochrome/quinol oxidase subunit 2
MAILLHPAVDFRPQAPAPQSAAAQSPATGTLVTNPVVIHMTAQKYRFDPSPVHVKSGSHVQLLIKALDRIHGFSINTFPDKAAAKEPSGLVFDHAEKCWHIEVGKETEIDFEARQPGTYAFKCCDFCGMGHMGMKGELIVDP